MAELSQTFDETARKIAATILQGLANVSQVEVAKACDISESTVSRWKSEEVPAISRFIAAIGLKVVPAAWECRDPEEIAALQVLARIALERRK